MQLDPNKNAVGDYYFPINVRQMEDLVGKVLTQVESMNLRENVEKAAKDVFRQQLWRWFDSVQENSISSWKLCIGPIETTDSGNPKQDHDTFVWHTQVGTIAGNDQKE